MNDETMRNLEKFHTMAVDTWLQLLRFLSPRQHDETVKTIAAWKRTQVYLDTRRTSRRRRR